MEVATVALSGTGKTIGVRGSTYTDAILDAVVDPDARGTSWSNMISVTNYGQESVVLAPAFGQNVISFNSSQRYIQFDGINLVQAQSGAALDLGILSDHCRFQNAELTNDNAAGVVGTVNMGANGQNGPEFHEFINLNVHGLGGPYGFYLKGNYNLVEGCNVHHVDGGGFHVYNNGGTPKGNIIRNCQIHDIYTYTYFGAPRNGFFGILAAGSSHVMYNNIIYNVDDTQWCIDNSLTQDVTQTHGILFYQGNNHQAWNNTITRVVGRFITFGTADSVVRNNLGYQNSVGSVVQDSTTVNPTNDHNFEQSTNPLFLSSADFHLSSGSTCVDQGIASTIFTTDLDGVTRPQGSTWDQGAYERAK